MDYTVQIGRLEHHGRDVAAVGADAAYTLHAVRLDAAATAMPGSMSGVAAVALHGRFASAAGTLASGLEAYGSSTHATVDGYRQQEDKAAAAITQFFGG
ncbi:hypothetical protein [Tessaracoccus antarcticus]|uniref:ESX-1 secretion-associated protein n=1 Tax=Tessaracoccus antarcticus TaxID=2479848 RepID=A0A3M0GJE7_9ACTN|nr:hypothetical protein [Tessaracoccus antarcticus]RMB61239.1 hypothetical protein EAX62_00770 [Tessaracoccus antarcticus]